VAAAALLDRLAPDRPGLGHAVSVLSDYDDAQPVAYVRRVDDVRRLRGLRDLDAPVALVAALPGVAERSRMTGPAAVRSSQRISDPSLSLDLGSGEVARRAEGARRGATCEEQRGCKQAENDGGGGAAIEHDGGLVLALLDRRGGRFFHPQKWLPRTGPDSCSEKHWTERIVRPAPPKSARSICRLVTWEPSAIPLPTTSHPPTRRGFDSGLKKAVSGPYAQGVPQIWGRHGKQREVVGTAWPR